MARLVMKNYLLSLFVVFFALPMMAQNDSIHQLDEVVLYRPVLKEFSNTQHLQVLKDSLIEKASSSLTDILQWNSSVYFKENGRGMVSSIAFRGTTAQQTAVVWNGININSKFHGQTDFNSININGYDAIAIRSGGGGVLYGSGAIGGSVHLRNIFQFEKGFGHALKLAYGSFNTFEGDYEFSYSDEKLSAQISLARTSSDNDYPYVDSDRENLNGQYENNNVKVNAAYKIDQNNRLELHATWYDGKRNFSLILPSETPTKYNNFHSWNSLAWKSNFNRFSSDLKLAYLKEQQEYYPDIENANHTRDVAETFLVKYDVGADLNHGISLRALFDYSYTKGVGASVPKNFQKVGSAGLQMKQRVSNGFLYEIGAKKEFTQTYKSPFLFSMGTIFNLNDFYSIKLNASKNYRIPTFNDLYWEESGNTDLKPETSYQGEIGNYFHWKNLDFSVTAYLVEIQDMIRWVPAGRLWRPTNTDKVQTYGLESNFNYRFHFQAHHFSFQASYGYTDSENKNTGKQLIYIPYHKATAGLGYRFKHWNFNYNFLYNGEVFTRSDNKEEFNLPGYRVSNLGVAYTYPLNKETQLKLGAKILNLYNQNYQAVENRFMPGRNYLIYLTFKF